MRWRFKKFRVQLRRWFRWAPKSTPIVVQATQSPKWHVIILDGTLSSFEIGRETNAGQLAKLLGKSRPDVYVYYEPGLQFNGWKSLWALATGKGIGAQICRAYGELSARYTPGDRIILSGYSRGAFAVRSLSGLIDAIGLLKSDCVSDHTIDQAWQFYQNGATSDRAKYFQTNYCLAHIKIDAVGVWDTVRALGLRPPYLDAILPDPNAFHSHDLPACVHAGFHAMAHDEVRSAFQLVKWDTCYNPESTLKQVWFRGAHGDVGGHLSGNEAVRPLSNIPFVWMVENFQAIGLPCPEGWQAKFPCDPNVQPLGPWRGLGRFLFLRKKRKVDLSAGETFHSSFRPHQ